MRLLIIAAILLSSCHTRPPLDASAEQMQNVLQTEIELLKVRNEELTGMLENVQNEKYIIIKHAGKLYQAYPVEVGYDD